MGYNLGVAPTKNVIILVVTVTVRGPYPSYNYNYNPQESLENTPCHGYTPLSLEAGKRFFTWFFTTQKTIHFRYHSFFLMLYDYPKCQGGFYEDNFLLQKVRLVKDLVFNFCVRMRNHWTTSLSILGSTKVPFNMFVRIFALNIPSSF